MSAMQLAHSGQRTDIFGLFTTIAGRPKGGLPARAALLYHPFPRTVNTACRERLVVINFEHSFYLSCEPRST